MNNWGVKQAKKNQNDFFSPASRTAGFTLFEMLIVLTVITGLAVLTQISFSGLTYRYLSQSETNNIRENIATQRSKSQAALENSAYGVKVGASNVTFFTGTSYSAVASDNVVFDLRSVVATTDLSSGGDEWYFATRTGAPSATGTIELYSNLTQATTTITIYDSGTVE